MRRPSRIPKVIRIGSLNRNSGRKNEGHRRFVASLSCAVCGRSPCQAAHYRSGGGGGMGYKPPDSKCLPLCGPRPGDEGCHARQGRIGEIRFWSEMMIDPLGLAEKLWTLSAENDLEAAERSVFAFRQRLQLVKGEKIYGRHFISDDASK